MTKERIENESLNEKGFNLKEYQRLFGEPTAKRLTELATELDNSGQDWATYHNDAKEAIRDAGRGFKGGRTGAAKYIMANRLPASAVGSVNFAKQLNTVGMKLKEFDKLSAEPYGLFSSKRDGFINNLEETGTNFKDFDKVVKDLQKKSDFDMAKSGELLTALKDSKMTLTNFKNLSGDPYNLTPQESVDFVKELDKEGRTFAQFTEKLYKMQVTFDEFKASDRGVNSVMKLDTDTVKAKGFTASLDEQAKAGAKRGWDLIRKNLAKIAQLAPKGKQITVDRSYHAEVLRPMHNAVGARKGDAALLGLVDDTVTTNKASTDREYQKFEAGGEKLVDTAKRLWDESGRNYEAFLGEITNYVKTNQAELGLTDGQVVKLDGVEYLSPEKRAELEVTFDTADNKLKMGGDAYDTSYITTGKGKGGEAAFVINAEGVLRAAPHEGGSFHHSSFEAAGRVTTAGMIKVTDGRIESISNNSGHYKPNEVNMYEGIKALPAEAFAEGAVVKIHGKQPELLSDFMDRVAPLAVEHWKAVDEERKQYNEKIDSISATKKNVERTTPTISARDRAESRELLEKMVVSANKNPSVANDQTRTPKKRGTDLAV